MKGEQEWGWDIMEVQLHLPPPAGRRLGGVISGGGNSGGRNDGGPHTQFDPEFRITKTISSINKNHTHKKEEGTNI